MKKIMDILTYTKNFGLRMQLLRILIAVSYKVDLREIYYKLVFIKQRKILRFLEKKYGHILKKYVDVNRVVSKSSGIIWTCWWQGEDSAPQLMKSCINSIRKNAGNHQVVVITLDNYQDYVQIPEHIVDMFKEGVISYTHLSDVLRMALLAKHGGLWLDATYYCLNPIPDSIFDTRFFTARWDFNDGLKYWYPYVFCILNDDEQKIGWSQNAIGGGIGHPLFSFVSEVFSEYLSDYSASSDYSTFIDYFLMDYIIRLAYDNIPVVKKDIDAIPINNLLTFKLWRLRNDEYNQEIIDTFRQSDTMFFKLSHWSNASEYTDSGKETVYKRLMLGNL